jgi:hypothetical protein
LVRPLFSQKLLLKNRTARSWLLLFDFLFNFLDLSPWLFCPYLFSYCWIRLLVCVISSIPTSYLLIIFSLIIYLVWSSFRTLERWVLCQLLLFTERLECSLIASVSFFQPCLFNRNRRLWDVVLMWLRLMSSGIDFDLLNLFLSFAQKLG